MPRKIESKKDWRRALFSDARLLWPLSAEDYSRIAKTLYGIEIGDPLEEDQLELLCQVEEAVIRYRVLTNNVNEPKPNEMKSNLEKLAKASRTFLKSFENVDIYSVARIESKALGVARSDPPPERLAGLGWHDFPFTNSISSSVERLASIAEAAANDLGHARKGRRNHLALKILIDHLADVWTKATGVEFSTSNKRGRAKDFVTVVVAIADSSVDASSIKTAMVAVIKNR